MTDPMTPPRMRTWLRVLLFGSLALNMLVLGSAAALALRGRAELAEGRSARPAPILYYMALDRDDRRALRAAQRRDVPHDPEARALRRAAVLAALRADPFDPAGFEAALAADLAAEQARAASLRAALVAQVGAMDATARAAYARRIEEGAQHGPDRAGRDGPEREKPPRD